MRSTTTAALASTLAVAAAFAQPKTLPGDAPPKPFEGFPSTAMPLPGIPGAYTHPDVPDGYVLIQGDIQVRLTDYIAFLTGRDAVFGPQNFWTLGFVPYGFDENVNSTNRDRAIAAMNAIASRAGVRFVPFSGGSVWIWFRNSDHNSSPVGMGPNTINISSWSEPYVIIHEIYHSLGFWHQQSASNRNTYVTINYGNICGDCCSGGGCAHNFDIVGSASLYGAYDFDSFMHYPRWAFSRNNEDTITVNEPWRAQWQDRIGQRDHFSYWDQIVCRGIYPYANDTWWEPGGSGFLGSLTSPRGGSLPSLMNSGLFDNIFIKEYGSYAAVGTYSTPVTIRAPLGARLR